MEHDKQYDSVAAFYDACVTVDFDIPFFLDEAQRAGGPVLELMCGSGRVSVPLLEAGVPLTCVDFSAGLLDILERKLATRGLAADLVLSDVRKLVLPRKLDLIFVRFIHSPRSPTWMTNTRSCGAWPATCPRTVASSARCTTRPFDCRR